MSLLMAAMVEALLFTFHLHGRTPIDVHVHTLLIVSVIASVVSVAIECKYRDHMLSAFSRALCALIQGFWFCSVGFILYPPFSSGPPEESHSKQMLLTTQQKKLLSKSEGIYWSKQLESVTPFGFSAIDDNRFAQLINTSDVIEMVDGCGRQQNRLITLSAGQKSCVRYRPNVDQIQGEIFSFYLARVLGISNVAPTTADVVSAPKAHPLDTQWKRVSKQIQSSRWADAKPIVLTQYVSDLVPAYIPHQLSSANRRLHPVAEDIGALNVTQLTELVQWSDLIVFDYLTANLDRFVNNMVNEKWNREMMTNPVHNLLKVRSSGLLVFIDNESGLLHGYRLLDKYERQHWSVLRALCIFRETTAKRQNVLDEKAYRSLPFLPTHNWQILYDRIDRP
ncbi:unnamed protein product, partial [Medioppia subpectinata]